MLYICPGSVAASTIATLNCAVAAFAHMVKSDDVTVVSDVTVL